MFVALIRGCAAACDVMSRARTEAWQAGGGLGTAPGTGLLLLIWTLGHIILEMFVLFTRRKKMIELEE